MQLRIFTNAMMICQGCHETRVLFIFNNVFNFALMQIAQILQPNVVLDALFTNCHYLHKLPCIINQSDFLQIYETFFVFSLLCDKKVLYVIVYEINFGAQL